MPDQKIGRTSVFGQLGSFTTHGCNNAGAINADSLCAPRGVALDSSGNVYIADSNNNRTLEYNSPLTTNTTADRVFGQLNFTTGLCNKGEFNPSSTSLCKPDSVAIDGANSLYVVDNANNRMLECFTPILSGTVADRVFGQLNNFNTTLNNNGGISASDCLPDSTNARVSWRADLSID